MLKRVVCFRKRIFGAIVLFDGLGIISLLPFTLIHSLSFVILLAGCDIATVEFWSPNFLLRPDLGQNNY
jgi:hypothetical protein